MIRVLCADISSADEQVYESLYERASEERKRRARRYLRREDKLRCVTAGVLLQTVLGTDDFQIEKNGFGKPYIKGRSDFYYNLSHSGKYVVLAFGDAEVGVDIQQHCADTDMRMIAEAFFSRDEQEYIWQSEPQARERFYEVWTGKESYLKYVGEGLRKDMRSFSVCDRELNIRCLQHTPSDGYTLSLCSANKKYTLELLNVRQLL